MNIDLALHSLDSIKAVVSAPVKQIDMTIKRVGNDMKMQQSRIAVLKEDAEENVELTPPEKDKEKEKEKEPVKKKRKSFVAAQPSSKNASTATNAANAANAVTASGQSQPHQSTKTALEASSTSQRNDASRADDDDLDNNSVSSNGKGRSVLT